MFSNKSTLAAYQLSELRIENDELRSQLAETRGIAGELTAALEQMVEGEPWQYLSCHKNSPVKDCVHCGRYYDANAALAKWKAAGISPELCKSTQTGLV